MSVSLTSEHERSHELVAGVANRLHAIVNQIRAREYNRRFRCRSVKPFGSSFVMGVGSALKIQPYRIEAERATGFARWIIDDDSVNIALGAAVSMDCWVVLRSGSVAQPCLQTPEKPRMPTLSARLILSGLLNAQIAVHRHDEDDSVTSETMSLVPRFI
jgi:hypothetical protein